ncbi:MAG: histidine--tRNA ligase [Bacteroidota bacterium]
MQGKKPTLIKGTRDFDALQVFRRNYILDVIQHSYQKHGFMPIETPALEHLSTLTGKYGEEGEQLIFKILNSGDFLAGVTDYTKDYNTLLPHIAGKGLRYDLTVPLMRYVAMNRDKITFPFKRYQMQPVWRADRPQQSRYREFYQCDIDVVGTSSLLCEAEILVIIHEVLEKLGVKDFAIHVNHRAILKSLATLAGAASQEKALCVALDKLDKVGKDQVLAELKQKGFTPTALTRLAFIFDLPTAQADKWALLTQKLGATQTGMQEIQKIFHYATALGLTQPAMILDPTLARGLSYYTGTIFEVKTKHASWGSLGGGGRYDGLTDVFGVAGVSGVGFSFGLDRLYAVLEMLDLFPASIDCSTQVLVTNLSHAAETRSLQVLTTLRNKNIRSEIYPTTAKLKKQLQYAHKAEIPFVAIIGEEEHAAGIITLKNMQTGTQQPHSLEQLLQVLSHLYQ